MKIQGKRNLLLQIRVSAEEKRALQERAAKKGKKVAQYVRDAAIPPEKM